MADIFEINEQKVKEAKERYLNEVVKPSFPFIKYFGGTSWTHQDGQKIQVSFDLPKHFITLKDSEYYFDKSTSFVHYTSLKNAVNILNDGFFRLNSLSYMDDPQELSYAGNEIFENSEYEDLKSLKDRVFCISLCEYEEEKSPEMFDSWRLYGDNGNGVGIVFKFSSEVENWHDHYLSKIYYGNLLTNESKQEKSAKKFKIFRDNHTKFIKANEGAIDFLSSQFGKKGGMPEWLAIFLAFHKSSLYTNEKEIRFLKYGSLPDSFTLSNKFEKVLYDKILIKTRENVKSISEKMKTLVTNTVKDINREEWIREMTKGSPIIELQKVIIGYRQSKNFYSIKKGLEDGFLDKQGYKIDVELSALANAFN
jgi:hypothetical protein